MDKNIFLFIGIMAIGVFVIPSVYSIFAGEHFFYDPGQTSCLKCHSDVKDELYSSAYHGNLTCENCHVDPNLNNQGSHGNVIVPKCTNCHNINIDSDSHKPFMQSGNNNDACVACHTEKSLNFQISLDDTYKLYASRLNDWQISNYSKYMISNPLTVQYNGTGGDHTFQSLDQFNCEKCHSFEQDEKNKTSIHSTLSCNNCHQLNPGYHVANIPSCLNCHKYDISNQADAHVPFVKSGNINNYDGQDNVACSLCHSDFNKDIIFTRPSYLEYDIVNESGNWVIQNLAIGESKDVEISSNLSGNIHNTTLEDDCVFCHDDIKQAVIAGGHSNEQWQGKHNYTGYTDMNLYCKSCHMPSTEKDGQSPYPAPPFDSNVHGSMKITCTDCHNSKSDLFANINGNMVEASFNDQDMGNIAISIEQQPYYLSSYLCIACKNVGNPVVNNSIHFKILTEPDVKVYFNITPAVTAVTAPPTIPIPSPSPTITPIPTITETPLPTITPIEVTLIPTIPIPSPSPTITPTPTITETPLPTLTATPITPIPTTTAIPTIIPTEIPLPTITIMPTSTTTPGPSPTMPTNSAITIS